MEDVWHGRHVEWEKWAASNGDPEEAQQQPFSIWNDLFLAPSPDQHTFGAPDQHTFGATTSSSGHDLQHQMIAQTGGQHIALSSSGGAQAPGGAQTRASGFLSRSGGGAFTET